MRMCGDWMTANEVNESAKYETVHIEKTNASCSLCDEYCEKNKNKKVAVISCEGACLRGEISRRVANLICHDIMPDSTVRICAGSAFTKNTGQRNLVQNAKKVVVLEGCFVKCASRTMNGVIVDFNPQIILTDTIARFDKNIFGANELSENDISKITREAAEKIAAMI
jgi:uncharacterized metal-binding protein